MKTTETQKSITMLDCYDFPELVQQFETELKLTKSEANQLFIDTKRYLYLCTKSDEKLSPSKLIDEGWHRFILFTKDYESFCKKYFGEFIHHKPYSLSEKLIAKTSGQQTALSLAKNLFGNNLSKNWYFEAADCDDCCPIYDPPR